MDEKGPFGDGQESPEPADVFGSDEAMEYAIELVKHRARDMVGFAGITESDRDDVEQELMFDLLRRLPKYDPSIAKLTTFMTRVVDHRCATIVMDRKAGMRDYRMCAMSLNQVMEDEEDAFFEQTDGPDREEYLNRRGVLPEAPARRLDLTIDVQRAVDLLDPNLQELCERLRTQRVSEVARGARMARSSLYESMAKIRMLFEDVGVGEYLGIVGHFSVPCGK